MTGIDRVLIEKEVYCPQCRKKHVLRYPNPRLYVVGDRESDLHVTSYRWIGGEDIDLLPHYYFAWQCPSCLFADLAESVENPKGTVKDLHLKETWSRTGDDEKQVLEEIRKLISGGDLDFNSAVAMHLAAIYVTLLPDKENVDHNKLGRLTLRLGWLFRESGQKVEEPAEDAGPGAKLRNDVETLERRLAAMAAAIGDSKRSALSFVSEGAEGSEAEQENPYLPIVDSLSDKLEDMNTLIMMLQRLVLRNSKKMMESIGADIEARAGELDGAFSRLRTRWALIPTNEEQCLRMAVDAYDYSYAHETAFQSIEQSMTVVRLIVDLLMRIRESERALAYIHRIYKTGMNNKVALQRRITEGRRHKKISIHDEHMVRRKIATIDNVIQEAGEARRKLLNVLIEKYNDRINEIIRTVENKTPAEQEKALIQGGIQEELLGELRKRNIIRDEKKKKSKGFFSR